MKNYPIFNKSGSEFGEQTCLFQWANSKETRQRFPHFYQAPKDGKAGRCKMFSTHQNFNDAIKGARAKQAGIQSGVADIFIPLPRHGCCGLFVEMKINPNHPQNLRTGKKGQTIASKRGEASPDQLAFRDQVREDGFGWALCEGWEAARDVILQYLSD